jgi:hypothetical protein
MSTPNYSTLSYQTPTKSISTCELIQNLRQKEEEQGTELGIRESLLEVLAELVAFKTGRHIYVKCKIYLQLLEISWQNPNLEKRLDVSRQTSGNRVALTL